MAKRVRRSPDSSDSLAIFDGVMPLHLASARGVRCFRREGLSHSRTVFSVLRPAMGRHINYSPVVLLNAFPKSNTGRSGPAEMAGMTRDRENDRKALS